MTQKLIILDRDGVINYDSDDYIKSTNEWLPINSSLSAIAKLHQAGFIIAVASNQSGLSRGLFTEQTLNDIHNKMLSVIKKSGGHIHAIEYCPDHPSNAGPDRKPAPGMLNRLLKKFDAKPEDTWFIGDAISDIQCAKKAGCKPALVLTGKGQKTLNSVGFNKKEIPVFDNLLDFVNNKPC